MIKQWLFLCLRAILSYQNLVLLIVTIATPITCLANEKINVFVSIVPQQYLVQRIAQQYANVYVMVKADQSPETFEPSPKLMLHYAKSQVYFTIGMPFEKIWIDRVASLNSDILVVPTEKVLSSSKQLQHDPHSWLSPKESLKQADIIRDHLIKFMPQYKVQLQANYEQLIEEIKVLDNELRQLFQSTSQTRFIVYHPAFSYFAEHYALEQIAIEVNGNEPSAKHIYRIIKKMKDHKVAYIIVEKQFNQSVATTIASSVDAKLLVLDPLALDYLSNMRDIAAKIKKALF